MKMIKYECGKCGARNVKLWRQSFTVASAVDLLCFKCAEADQRPSNEPGWQSSFAKDEGDQIGALVPACLTDDGKTFWCYTSAPQEACNTWNGLPPNPKPPVPIEPGSSLMEKYRAESTQKQTAWIAETFFLVEATSFEHQMLWERWSIQALELDRKLYRLSEHPHRVAWEQLSPGFGQQVGEIAGRPVCVSVQFARVAGRVVVFYEATSQVSDSVMIEKWLEETFKDLNTRRAQTNASNFHICVHAITGQNDKQIGQAHDALPAL